MYKSNYENKRDSTYMNNDDNRTPDNNPKSSYTSAKNYSTKPHYRDKKKSRIESPAVKKFQVCGKDIAINFTCDHISKGSISTINMDVASRFEANTNDEYDWVNKIAVQIPRVELPLITAILLGDLVHARFKQKSIYGDRSYAFLHKDDKLTIHFFEKNKTERSIIISPNDSYHITDLFLRQLRKNSPWMTTGEIIALIKHTVVSLRLNPDQAEVFDIDFPDDGSEDSFSFSFNEQYIEDENFDFPGELTNLD